jgi:hypothetical protein
MIFLKDNPVYGLEPINDSMDQQEITDLAKIIVDAIRPPQKCLFRQTYEPWVELKFENPSDLQSKDDLDRALVQDANREALSLFDFIQKPPTWGKLRSGLPEDKEDDRWREELFHVIRKIIGGRQFSPVQAVFQTKDGRLIRPVACAVDRVGSIDGPIEVATYLRYAFRFRWEVLEKFGTSPMSEDDVERLHNTLERMQAEATSRGIIGVDAILGLFPPEQANRTSEMYHKWYQTSNPEGKGELDIAIKNKEVDKIPEILARFIPASQEFLEVTADRFSELITKIAKS